MSWRTCLATAFVLVLANPVLDARAQPAIRITPSDVLEGAPVHVVLSGLEPGGTVTVRASRAGPLYPRGDELYRGRGVFKADAQGTVDLSTSAPLAGSTFDRPSAAGLLWSMAPARRQGVTAGEPASPPISADDVRTGRVVLEAEAANGVARAEVMLRPAAPDVAVREIRDAGVTGVYARSANPRTQRAVIVLGGSEGGLFTARQIAPLIASHGYAVLGVGYFQGVEAELSDLRPNLELIPVEVLEAARGWLAAQPGVDASQVALVGVSKGAELALLGAVNFDWVAAVAAFAPSHVVWEGIPPDGAREWIAKSSWTVKGRPAPFVRWSRAAERRGDSARAATGVSRLTEVHLESLVEYASDIEAARLPVERSRAAFFLVAGQDDGMWPSAYSAEQLQARLRARSGQETQVELFPAGHQILGTGWGPTTAFHRLTGLRHGGDARLDAEAQAAAWPKFLEFLDRHMGRGGNVRSQAGPQ